MQEFESENNSFSTGQWPTQSSKIPKLGMEGLHSGKKETRGFQSALKKITLSFPLDREIRKL